MQTEPVHVIVLILAHLRVSGPPSRSMDCSLLAPLQKGVTNLESIIYQDYSKFGDKLIENFIKNLKI